jgi:hypothetical protein
MTTNERELAQLERTAEHVQADQALALVEVAARDEAGNIKQCRRLRTVTDTEVRAFLRRKERRRAPMTEAMKDHLRLQFTLIRGFA